MSSTTMLIIAMILGGSCMFGLGYLSWREGYGPTATRTRRQQPAQWAAMGSVTATAAEPDPEPEPEPEPAPRPVELPPAASRPPARRPTPPAYKPPAHRDGPTDDQVGDAARRLIVRFDGIIRQYETGAAAAQTERDHHQAETGRLLEIIDQLSHRLELAYVEPMVEYLDTHGPTRDRDLAAAHGLSHDSAEFSARITRAMTDGALRGAYNNDLSRIYWVDIGPPSAEPGMVEVYDADVAPTTTQALQEATNG